MLHFALRRLLQGVIAAIVLVSVVFFLARLNGDPTALLAPPNAAPAEIDRLRANLGYDRPIPVQYIAFLGDLVRGDLGSSTSFKTSVIDLVLPAMAQTARLALIAFLLALVAGVVLGTLAGMRAQSRTDTTVRVAAVVGQSIPSFWLGMLLILLFSVTLGWLPAFGAIGAASVILPAIALAALPTAAIARMTRSTVIEIYGKDFTLFERSKGVAPSVLLTHIMRNASLPVVTLAGIQLGAMFSQTIVVESLFAWPGVGQLAISAINTKDFALVQGVVIVNTLVFVGLLFVVDMLYGVLDPRVRDHEAKVGA
jgi:peptide/nickel transport system permease protein